MVGGMGGVCCVVVWCGVVLHSVFGLRVLTICWSWQGIEDVWLEFDVGAFRSSMQTCKDCRYWDAEMYIDICFPQVYHHNVSRLDSCDVTPYDA